MLDRFTLEWGLIVGALMTLGGGGVLPWRRSCAGRTPTSAAWPPTTCVSLLLGLLLVVAGAQVVLVSFLLSLTRIGEDASSTPPVTIDVTATPTAV